MDQLEYYGLISNEKNAQRYLLRKCFTNYQRYCPRCRERNLYRLQKGNFRCSRCAYTFHDFSGRWINRGRLRPVQWLSIIRYFEKEVSVREITWKLNISYQSVYKAMMNIRLAILNHAEDVQILLEGDIELADAYYGGRNKDTREQGIVKIPVFGIKEKDDQVQVSIISDMSPATVLQLNTKKVRKGNVVYTGRYEGYDSLIFSGYRDLKADHETQFSSGKVHIDNSVGFWNWAKKRLIKQHGFSKAYFPLYLKEVEFRYNNRDHDIFDKVATYLCDLVPNRNGTTNKKGKA